MSSIIGLGTIAPSGAPARSSAATPPASSPSSPASPHPARQIDGITDREREVLTLVGRGMTNNDIVASLCISTVAAKAHVARLLTKLGARDGVQLVIAAYQTRLVSPSQ